MRRAMTLPLLLALLAMAGPAQAQRPVPERLIARCIGEDPGASPADAATACTALLEMRGGDAQRRGALLTARAVALHRQGAEAEALADLNAAIGLWPDAVPPRFLRALILRDRGETEAAEADLTAAIATTPDQAELFNNRGGLRRARGDLAAARADYARAVALQPGYAKALANLALTRHRLGEAGVAEDLAAAIAAAGPEEGWPHAVSGALALERGDLAAAAADLEESLEREPDDAETLWLRSLLRARQGDASGAAADAARAQRLLPRVEPLMLGIFGPSIAPR
jgi:Tfp pilus assembly protein PilF